MTDKLNRIMQYLSQRIGEEHRTHPNDLRIADGYWKAGFILGEARNKVFADILAAENSYIPCSHNRLNEDGACRQCGKDCRGIY